MYQLEQVFGDIGYNETLQMRAHGQFSVKSINSEGFA
jgi:hypothetical protein